MAEVHSTGKADCRCEGGDSDIRCRCGSMLAMLKDGGFEIKCRRCKRILLISFPPGTRFIEKSYA